MRWLKQFKRLVDSNPFISDGELFRAFPELQGDERRLTYALVYWRHGIVVDELVNKTIWYRVKKYIVNGFRRICYGIRPA